ncbi:MAG: hypothetical protein ACRC5R_00295 [Mycoplasmatales bacterium]
MIKLSDINPIKKFVFLPSSAIPIICYLEENKKIDISVLEENVKCFYLKSKNKSNKEGFYLDLSKEAIVNYKGVKYIDDNVGLVEDFMDKDSLFAMKKFLNNKNIDPKTQYAILHAFNELDRNVRNHSGIKDRDNKDYLYCANYYKKTNEIQITILDEGQGFNGSMAGMGYEDNVLESVKKDITARSNHYLASEGSKNSGYGLFMLNALSKIGNHNLEIISNGDYYTNFRNDFIKCPKSNFLLELENTNFTLVSISLNLDTLSEDLDKVNEESINKSAKSTIDYRKIEQLEEAFVKRIEVENITNNVKSNQPRQKM